MIYVFQQRYCHTRIDYRIASENAAFALAKGFKVNEPVEVYDINDRHFTDLELHDFQGNPMEGLITEKMKVVLDEIDPSGEYLMIHRAAITNRPEIEEPLFLADFMPKIFPRTIIDIDSSRVHLDEDGSVVSTFKISFTADFSETVSDSFLFFGMEEFGPLHLFLTEKTARALDDAGLTGFKLFASEIFQDGMRHKDPYLNPDHPPFHSVPDVQKRERPRSIIDKTGREKNEWEPAWDPENEYTRWDEL
jgi:hypothetical protein